MERHRDVVYRVAVRIVGHDDADDVAQDAFVRAYHRLEQYRGGSFRGWVLQITRTVALNELRRRRPDPHDGAAEQESPDTGPGLPRPARALEIKEQVERLESKIGLLSEKHRTVLVLRDVEGLPYEEIASITDTPIGSVKGRLHRARAEMIDMLRNNTYDWDLPDE